MNIPPTDDNLARAHAAFRRNHEAGRQRLLDRLSGEDSTTVTKGSISMKVIFRKITSDWSLRSPGRTIGKAAVAAALLVAIALGFHAWFGERQAYALDDLPQRLMELRSIYMTGWQCYPRLLAGGASEPGPKLPITMFAERRTAIGRRITNSPLTRTTKKDTFRPATGPATVENNWPCLPSRSWPP